MTSTTFPNGQTLTSSAQSPDTLAAILQTLTAQMLGFNPASDTDAAYYSVRVEWPTEGQPFGLITEDIVFIRAREDDDGYGQTRDTKYAANDAASVRQITTFGRTWIVSWVFYGPNSFDHARIIATAMYQDFVHDALAASDLYLVLDPARPQYAPENMGGQWWRRTDLDLRINELVTENLTTPSIASSEVIALDATSTLVDLHIT